MSQLSLLAIGQNKKTLKCKRLLDEMNLVIPWKKICSLIEPYYHKGDRGRPPFKLETMLRTYCLQQWYQLSDPATEEAIYDRNSFQQFLNLDLLCNKVPDETTILNFRHLLEKHHLTRKIFKLINNYLQEKGLMMTKGTIVDATLIQGPKSTKNKDKKRDPEMSSTHKNNQWYFGMKAHIGVDFESGLVHSVEATTAKVHDRQAFPSLLHGKEEVIFGDKAYDSDKDKFLARDIGVNWMVLGKKKRGMKQSKSQVKKNKRASKIRSKVEHPFQVVKNLWGYAKTRYRGIEKNFHQFFMLFGLYNLYKVRKKSCFLVS
jgi:transposase, IS5 family